MIETSERPLTEIRLAKETKNAILLAWLAENAKYTRDDGLDEFILLLPHPKHKALGGMSIGEFLNECPDNLAVAISEIYNNLEINRADYNTKYGTCDLDNDFGFILIAFV